MKLMLGKDALEFVETQGSTISNMKDVAVLSIEMKTISSIMYDHGKVHPSPTKSPHMPYMHAFLPFLSQRLFDSSLPRSLVADEHTVTITCQC
jgi:hypothetical protein